MIFINNYDKLNGLSIRAIFILEIYENGYIHAIFNLFSFLFYFSL